MDVSHRIGIGSRFKMSKLGAARCQELAGQTGVVVAVSRRTTGVTVLFDDARRPTVLHEDYISPTCEQDQVYTSASWEPRTAPAPAVRRSRYLE
jgi:hypothetical protein